MCISGNSDIKYLVCYVINLRRRDKISEQWMGERCIKLIINILLEQEYSCSDRFFC